MSVLPASLEESDRLFPTPDEEIQRIAKRTWILNYVPRGDVGIEVGVGRGRFSEVLLTHMKPRRVYFFDAWTLNGAPQAVPGSVAGDIARQEAQWRTERFAEVERHFVESTFPLGVQRVTEPVDWIYIDATNDVDVALAQLQACEKLLKPKGILAGDNWWPNPKSPLNAVFQAVNKFIRMGKFELIACGPYGQWAIRRR
ncbi:MAG TPA: class I SAM-dependent methyltransferase, partial [Burkholderiaceae bacterium]